MSGSSRRVVLASASPRRRLLLEEAGFDVEARPSDLDDGELCYRHTVSPGAWAMALAWFKARRVLDRERGLSSGASALVAADTLCVLGDEVIGQPRDAAHAREILRSLRRRAHHVITGVCIVSDEIEALFVDESHITMGEITDDMIEEYVASECWRGKAGAYNLNERIEAGWPVAFEGEAASIMGLPMRRIEALLDPGPASKRT